MNFRGPLALIAPCLLLSACGVPSLYDRPTNANRIPGSGDELVQYSQNAPLAAPSPAPTAPPSPAALPSAGAAPADSDDAQILAVDANEKRIAPKVEDVIDEIACELNDAHVAKGMLITVNLTLQIEDNQDLTPSITFTHALFGSGRTRAVLASGDLGGDRKRSFTTTYYLDSNLLSKATCDARDGDHRWKKKSNKLFTLTGNLKLDDIVQDGQATLARERPIAAKPDTTAKTLPSFGSSVIFTVTKQITGVGPEWTLSTIKYPSASGGLIDWKRVRTDTLNITFAMVVSSSPQAKKAIADAANARDEAKARAQNNADNVTVKRGQLGQLRARANFVENSESHLLQGQIDALSAKQRSLDSETETAQIKLDSLRQRDAESDETGARAAAAVAGQNLLTSMLLQNINIQPH